MKPTKNKYYCKNCGRTKMLFETEKKADNFIAFNQEKISKESEHTPQRSYFCIFCGGWHITSIKEEIGKSKNEKLLEQLLIKKTTSVKPKINHEENRTKLSLDIESRIKGMDYNQKEAFFTEQIDFLNKEIEDINNSSDQNNKEILKELRLKLEVLYIIRKQYGFHKSKNNYNEKLREKKEEEWLSWIKEIGHLE